MFLLTIVLGIIAQVFISERLISFRDPARTAGKPTLGYAAFSVVALIALAGSIVTIGWFLVKGVDEERWRALAATEAGR